MHLFRSLCCQQILIVTICDFFGLFAQRCFCNFTNLFFLFHLDKLFADGVCIQSIKHPGCVWDVKFLENGDIVTACSDGVVRIWTAHKDRIVEPHQLEAYAFLLSEYECSRFNCQFSIKLKSNSIEFIYTFEGLDKSPQQRWKMHSAATSKLPVQVILWFYGSQKRD